MNWYYAKEGRQVGPIGEAELQSLAASGVIGTLTLVWREGMGDWQPWGSVSAGGASAGAPGAANAAPATVCSQCGRSYAADELIRFGDRSVCATCKPAFLQALKEGVVTPGVMRYGGFWIRFGARFIDGLILGMIGFIISLPLMIRTFRSAGQPPSLQLFGFQMATYALRFVIACAYETAFVGRFGATPGKMAFGLRVVTPYGGRIGYARALARYFATIVSTITVGIGYIMAGFDDEKRALHDRICDTRVVKV